MKITQLSEEEQEAILNPVEPGIPKEVLLRRLEQLWLTAKADGRTKDMKDHDRQHKAVLEVKTDKAAHKAYEEEVGYPFLRPPSPPASTPPSTDS